MCAHGTDDPGGRQVVLDLTAAVARTHPELLVRDAYVDVQRPEIGPLVADLAAGGRAVTVVPLLLSSGFHLDTDVADAVAPWPNARAGGSLGPDPLLAQVLASRLREGGAVDGDVVVLAVAGSSRAAGAQDAQRMTELLAQRWPGQVSLGYCSAAQPSVEVAVARAREAGAQRVVVASYLIGPGFFQRRLGGVGADLVSAPLGADPRVVELVTRRYQEQRGPLDR